MKLYNRTPLDGEILKAVLTKAGRSVGARTAGVIVKVNLMQNHLGTRGLATECFSNRIGKRWIKTDGGDIKLTFSLHSMQPIEIARAILELARHEFGHIRDYQNGGRFAMEFSKPNSSGRRPIHDSRPEEIRVENYIYDSDKRLKCGYFDSELEQLAAEIDRVRKVKYPKLYSAENA